MSSLVKEWSEDQIASYLKPISLSFFKATPRKSRALILQGFLVYTLQTNVFGERQVSFSCNFLIFSCGLYMTSRNDRNGFL